MVQISSSLRDVQGKQDMRYALGNIGWAQAMTYLDWYLDMMRDDGQIWRWRNMDMTNSRHTQFVSFAPLPGYPSITILYSAMVLSTLHRTDNPQGSLQTSMTPSACSTTTLNLQTAYRPVTRYSTSIRVFLRRLIPTYPT